MEENKIQIIKDNLFDKKVAIKRKAALIIAKEQIIDCSNELLLAYINEQKIPSHKSWETQKYMLMALGMIKCKEAIPVLLENMRKDIPESVIIHSSALAYVRILRNNKADIQPIMDLYDTLNIKVIEGATQALAFDDMIPLEKDIERIIFFFNSIDNRIKIHSDMGENDPRFYLLAATANWNKELPCVSDFIKRCSCFINLGWIEKVKKGKKIVQE